MLLGQNMEAELGKESTFTKQSENFQSQKKVGLSLVIITLDLTTHWMNSCVMIPQLGKALLELDAQKGKVLLELDAQKGKARQDWALLFNALLHSLETGDEGQKKKIGEGLLLGSKSPFNNIPILGAIL